MTAFKSNPEPPAAGGGQQLVPVGTTTGAMETVSCWNRIGVNGDGTCAELTKFVHCRNCPVYSNAAALLLDRALPADYRRHWTGHFALEKKRVTPGRMSVVIFRVGTEWLALSTRAFQEVAERRRVHSLPHSRQGVVLGLVNIRGELLICVSLERLLGIEKSNLPARSRAVRDRLVVAEAQGSVFTFPVEEIHGVHRFHPEELKEAPATVSRGANPGFTHGLLAWGKKSVGCLNEEALFATLNRSLL